MVQKIALEAVQKLPGKNKYKICIAKPFFEEYQITQSTDFGVRKALGETYTFAKRDAGGHDELMAAVKSGEVAEVVDPKTGITDYQKTQFEC